MLQSLLASVGGPRPAPPKTTTQPNNDERVKNSLQFSEAQQDAAISRCSKCGGSSYWQPRFQSGVWKCSNCEPAPNPAFIERTRLIDDKGFALPSIDPFVVCMCEPICESCGSSWLEISMDGYRCAHCWAPVKKTGEEIFFCSISKETKNDQVFEEEAES